MNNADSSAYTALATFGRFEVVLGAVIGVTIALIIVCIGIFVAPKRAKLPFLGLGAVVGAATIGIADYALKSKPLSAVEGGLGFFETLLLVL
jgi:hypothetical protein